MNFEYLHPRDQIRQTMDRIYGRGLTTTSGGNISVKDEEGVIWITPAGKDKGTLEWQDIVKVLPDGTVSGLGRPSSEFPFHKAIYDSRPDLRSIVHAHPGALVAYSIVRELPPVAIIPQAFNICSRVDFAAYALPGSEELGRNIAAVFADGNDSVMLENHGVVCGGADLLEAFGRFETLEFCARLAIQAHRLGTPKTLNAAEMELRLHEKHLLPEFAPAVRTSEEKGLRRHLCEIMSRAYRHKLMTSTGGVASVRMDEENFLITPTGEDRSLLTPADIVLIRDRRREQGGMPSRSVLLHDCIYRKHPWVQAVITAQPPASLAFGITPEPFATRTIPESYILLRDIRKLPFGSQYEDEVQVADAVDSDHPVLLIENEAILVVGGSLLEAFDRLEVAEFSAASLIDAKSLGSLHEMDTEAIRDLSKHFLQK